jgi:eukaryotic-like serine/threonine-protein kinase
MDNRDPHSHALASTAGSDRSDDAGADDDELDDLSAAPGRDDGDLGRLLAAIASAPAVPPSSELRPGDELGDNYRIVRRLGAGGMGVVYLARDLELQRDVAVKVHRAAIGTERLYREALAMAQVAHPNVVTVHRVGRVGDRLYIAMEYVPGDNLSTWLSAAPRTWRQILDVMIAVGDGLAAAHAAGFVHRDVKPANILVGLDGRPRVGDFGLVRVASDGPRVDDDGDRPAIAVSIAVAVTATGDTRPRRSLVATATPRPNDTPLDRDLTALGTTMGTPAYMAPEQHAGLTVDARADQWSLAVVLYEALYGVRPWPGPGVAELREQVTTVAPRAPLRSNRPPWVWPVVRRALAVDPAARYSDVRSFVMALRTPPRRVPIGLVLAAVGLIGVAVVAIGFARSRAAVRSGSCDAAGSPVVAAWGPSARRQIFANYAKLDAARGPDAAGQLATALDAWSQRWQYAATTACDSIRAHRWSNAVTAASDACMKSSLAEGRALIAQAQHGPTVIADAARLSNVDVCADPNRLTGSTPQPPGAIEGHWRGDFGHLVVQRVGAEIWAVYGHDAGTVRGRLVGDRFVGWWCEAPSRQSPGDAGDVEMRVLIDRDGVRAIAGQWRYGTEGGWEDRWDLTLDPSPPPLALSVRFARVGDFCVRPTR